MRRRGVPARNICHIRTAERRKSFGRTTTRRSPGPSARVCAIGSTEQILYIVTTGGVPLKIPGRGAEGINGDTASVDSELTLLYSDLHTGKPHPSQAAGPIRFSANATPNSPIRSFPSTWLRGWRPTISTASRPLSTAPAGRQPGEFCHRSEVGLGTAGRRLAAHAAILLPKERVVLDESKKVIYGQSE